jgi:Spy/CpxP family protein refolding chaperone
MITKKRVVIAITVVFVISVAAAATAFHGCGFEKFPFHGPMKRLITGKIGRMLVLKSELNITDEQKEKIVEVVKARKGELIPGVKTVMVKKRALREAVLADSPNEKAIRTAAADLGKSIGDVAVLASKVVGEARPILTEKQIKRLERFRKDGDKALDQWLTEMAK